MSEKTNNTPKKSKRKRSKKRRKNPGGNIQPPIKKPTATKPTVPAVQPPDGVPNKAVFKKLHDFNVDDIVDVYFPKKNPFYLGRAVVTEVGRKSKGKDYDIEVTFEHSGDCKAVHPHHLKKVENPEDYPEVFDKDRVHVRPKYRAGYAGQTDNIPHPVEEKIRDFLDSLPAPQDEADAKKPVGCIRCHNGNLYSPGSRSTWKTEEGNHFSVPAFAEYMILVPAKFNAGRVSFKNRRRVESCHRCNGGRFVQFSTKHDGSGSINHKALLRMGYTGIITVSKKKN